MAESDEKRYHPVKIFFAEYNISEDKTQRHKRKIIFKLVSAIYVALYKLKPGSHKKYFYLFFLLCLLCLNLLFKLWSFSSIEAFPDDRDAAVLVCVHDLESNELVEFVAVG